MDVAIVAAVVLALAACLFGARLVSFAAVATAGALALNVFGMAPAATWAADVKAQQTQTAEKAHCKLRAYDRPGADGPEGLAAAQRACGAAR